MNFEWNKSIEKIKTDLKKMGYTEYSRQINERQLSGSMFGEIILGVCSKLLDIKISDQVAYNHIRMDAEKLIEYCIANGLYPQPNNLSEN